MKNAFEVNPMLTLLENPATIANVSRMTPTGSDPAAIANIVANLHTILTDPDSTWEEGQAAKRRLLDVLDAVKPIRLPHMIIPPLAEKTRAYRSKRGVRTAVADIDPVCEVCERPLAPRFASLRAPRAKRVRSRRGNPRVEATSRRTLSRDETRSRPTYADNIDHALTS